MSERTGKMLKAARGRAGHTMTDLAEVLGLSSSAICDIENGHRKDELSPEMMVKFSDALCDRTMLTDYCGSCPIRERIVIKKFPKLNKIIGGALGAAVKTSQKLAEASEMVQSMLGRMLKPGFQQDPEYREYRDQTIIKILDAKRGAEILLDQLIAEGVLTAEELRMLKSVQQMMCVEKGYHVEEGP